MATQDPPILTLKERHKLIFGTWNVTSFEKNDNVILNELKKYNVDIVCIQETKCKEGTVEIGDYKLVTKCYEEDMMIYGLGFMIKKTLYEYIEIEKDQTDRICFLKLRTDAGIVHIINVYFPQNDSELEKKEDCFLALQDKLLDISEDKIVFILGDFNSHIGSDNVAWFRCLEKHGIPCEVNDNGLRLLEFCTFYDLGITHSFFDQKGNAQYTYQSLSNKSKSYIDFCITRNKHRQFVKMTKANLPSQTSMDHLLVTSDIELSLSLNKKDCQDKTLSKSQFLLVSTFVILSCRSQQKNDAVEKKWQEIKKKLFGTESHDQLYEENFSKFQKQLEEILFIYNSVLEKNSNGRMTETERLGFGCIIKEIVKNYEDYSIENIKIPEQTMLDLLNSAINEGMASNVDDTDVLFQDLPTEEEIEKLFEYVEGQIDVKAILRPNVLILQQLYEMCWTSEYIPLELSFVGLACHKHKTATDNNNIFNLTYLIGRLYVSIMSVRVKKMRNKEINEQCVLDCESKSELLFQLCRHQEQHQKEDKELYRGFVSLRDKLKLTNTVFFEHLAKLNTPKKLLNILSSVLPFLQCSNYLCSEKYFWHRDAKAHCCSMDTILSYLSWSLVNKCLIKSKFKGNLSFVASYLNTVVIETQSGESLKDYLLLLQQICQSNGFQMSKPRVLAHNFKNSHEYKATFASTEFQQCSLVKYLDLIFSSDNEFDSEISYRISTSSIMLSNILKTFSPGTEENYMTIMSQFEKLVLEELSTNSKHFVVWPRQLKSLEDFRKKCKKRIKFFCGICRPSVKTLLSVKRLQFRKSLPPYLEDEIHKGKIDLRRYDDYHTQCERDAKYHGIGLATILDESKDEEKVKELLENTSRKIKWRELSNAQEHGERKQKVK